MLREMIWNLWATNANKSFDLDRKSIMVLPWDEPDLPRKEFSTQELAVMKRRLENARRK